MSDCSPQQPLQRTGGEAANTGPLDSIRKRLDDMLSTPFSSRIISYEPPRGSSCQNSLRMMDPVTHLIISVIIDKS